MSALGIAGPDTSALDRDLATHSESQERLRGELDQLNADLAAARQRLTELDARAELDGDDLRKEIAAVEEAIAATERTIRAKRAALDHAVAAHDHASEARLDALERYYQLVISETYAAIPAARVRTLDAFEQLQRALRAEYDLDRRLMLATNEFGALRERRTGRSVTPVSPRFGVLHMLGEIERFQRDVASDPATHEGLRHRG